MSITGEPDGAPMKAGVALSDVLTGLYSGIGILSALYHRKETGKGQLVDTSSARLYRCQPDKYCPILSDVP